MASYEEEGSVLSAIFGDTLSGECLHAPTKPDIIMFKYLWYDEAQDQTASCTFSHNLPGLIENLFDYYKLINKK